MASLLGDTVTTREATLQELFPYCTCVVLLDHLRVQGC